MLSDLGHDLEVFQIYESTFVRNEDMGSDLMDMFLEIITFWVQVTKFLRRNKHGICHLPCLSSLPIDSTSTRFNPELDLAQRAEAVERHFTTDTKTPPGDQRESRSFDIDAPY